MGWQPSLNLLPILRETSSEQYYSIPHTTMLSLNYLGELVQLHLSVSLQNELDLLLHSGLCHARDVMISLRLT